MKNPFKRSTDSASIEQELKRLGDRKVEAERRRSEVLAAVEDARAARRNLLDGDQAAIDQASVKLKTLQAEAADLAELLDDLEAAIEAATERFRHARDQEARSIAAAKLETVATAVEGQTAEFEKAVKALVKAARTMIDSIPQEIGIADGHYSSRPESRENRGMLTREEVVAAVVADALAAELPSFFDRGYGTGYRRALHCMVDATSPQPSYRSNEQRSPLPAREVVSALITTRLKDRAAKILAGELEPVLNDIRPIVVKPPAPTSIEIVATADVVFLVPNDPFKPVRKVMTIGRSEGFVIGKAERLIATGHFVKRSTPEGQKFLADLHEKNAKRHSSRGPIGPDDCIDLGDPLGLLEAVMEEVARID